MGLPENKKLYESISARLKAPAIRFLIKSLSDEAEKEIRQAILRDPEEWHIPYHFGWGMRVRNELRDAGYGEEYFGIGNLDDIYAELIEDAVR